ncbi:unnamed protein product [Alopecurus aequalis]
MESRSTTMAKAARAGGATPLYHGLPEEIVIWEILVRLSPKSLLRCRAVCQAWHRDTSTREFLVAHHGRQPSLPIVHGFLHADRNNQIFAFDHCAADDQLQPVARLDDTFYLEASCDGLLILSTYDKRGSCFTVCNPTTHQHAPLRQVSGFSLFTVLGMYLHRPTAEYRLLLHRRRRKMWTLSDLLREGQFGCYIYALGSDQSPRFIGGPETASACFNAPVLVRDNLHWYHNHSEKTASKRVIVFDTVHESFGQMSAPIVPSNPYIFETDDTLGMYNHNSVTEIVDIWMLQNYECEDWEHKYRVKLPVAKIRELGRREDYLYVSVLSSDGNLYLMLSNGRWLFYVDTNGELVDNFHRDGQKLYPSDRRLKQTLVPHNFFAPQEGYDVNPSPFI